MPAPGTPGIENKERGMEWSWLLAWQGEVSPKMPVADERISTGFHRTARRGRLDLVRRASR